VPLVYADIVVIMGGSCHSVVTAYIMWGFTLVVLFTRYCYGVQTKEDEMDEARGVHARDEKCELNFS
jgi:hypothetical protein